MPDARAALLRAVEKAIRLSRTGGGPDATEAVLRVPALLDAALEQARDEQRKTDAEIAQSMYPEVCACGTVIAAAILRGGEERR